jgi:N-glycosylase/DNA lyase
MGQTFEKYDEGIVIKDVVDFDLRHIFDCGQSFRWNEQKDGSFIGVASGRVVRMSKSCNHVYIKGGAMEDRDFWSEYLDLDRNYGEIKSKLSENDDILKEAMGHGEGIRILNQEPFEIVVSFIISANNRIPMIKKAVENISRNYGRKLEFEGKEYYSFPAPEMLVDATVDELEECGCGFRAPYIIETTKEIASGNVDLYKIKAMDTDEAHRSLKNLKGIGPKVADCILLFSMGKHDAFPVDVWVKRVMQYFYLAPDVSLKKIRDYGRDKFGSLAGFAQQYLFYYARDLKGKEGLEK